MIETFLFPRGVEILCTSHMLGNYLEKPVYPLSDQNMAYGKENQASNSYPINELV